jgi:hypothetical protein
MGTFGDYKLFIAILFALTLCLVNVPYASAHGSGGVDELLHEINSNKKSINKEKGMQPPSGSGLPAGVTKVFEGVRYQWNGSFWKQMSKSTW